MVKTYFMTLLLIVASVMGLHAQVTSSPSPLQEDSQDVKIFFHADQGNKGLMGLGPSARIYAHTGACLSDGRNWENAPTWGDNDDKYKLTYVSENLWQLNIGDIRSYYGITDPALSVTKLAFVFRTADCSKEGKGEGNSDIFIDVLSSGLQVVVETSFTGNLITPSTANASFSVGTTKNADITLSVNGEKIGEAANARSLNVDYTFPGVGEYELKATASAGGETVTSVARYSYVSDSMAENYPGGTPKMGPVKNADGSVTFCLGAPGKNNVMLYGAWNGYEISNNQVMKYQDVDGMRYFWTTVSGLENDRQYGYYFLVDGAIKVGDPYARLVLDPWNDKYISTDVYPNLPAYPFDHIDGVPLSVYQGNINDYDWKVTDFEGVAPDDLIIYELLFRDFTGTEGKADGNGTVRQAIEKIPYLKGLGVNAVEVLPINEFNGNISWGYNPNFYFAPDKAYGTPDDYKEFIDICHQNGIAVILDMVFNQSDGLHPWYQMYTPGQNPFYNLDAPHAYSVLNDWNQGYPMVQQQWDDVLRYWMTEYKFDGFRFDLVKGLGDNDSYANNGDAATNAYNASRVARMRRLQEVMNEINPKAYFINENLAGSREENEMGETGQLNWANVNNAGCQFAMGYQNESDLNRMYAPKDSRTWGSTVSYLESHDEQRLAYKQDMWGVSGVKGNIPNSMRRLGSAAVQMILSPGAHMIWQFSELGNAENTKDNNGGNNTDPKRVEWSLYDNPDRKGLYDNYAQLISLRNNNPELFSEEASFEIHCSASDWTKGRTMYSRYGGKELITIINPNTSGSLTVENVAFSKTDNAAYTVFSKSYESYPSFDASAGTVTVPANCYVTIGTNDISSVEDVASDSSLSGLSVYGRDGVLTVDYADGNVEVFSLDGRRVGRIAGAGSINVGSGVFIVKCGSEVRKIAL